MNLDNLKQKGREKLSKENLKPTTGKKKMLLGVIVILLAALGLESTNNDWDLGKIIAGESLSESKVIRDNEGNIVPEGTPGSKAEDDYNCPDFTNQPKAQNFYEKAGGVSNDLNRLDGDKDGEACEDLPQT